METIALALVATLVPIYTLYINFRKDKTISLLTETNKDQSATIDRLTLEIDGLPKRVAEQLANNIVLTQVASDLRQKLIEAGVPLEEQPPPADIQPLTPMTKGADTAVRNVIEEQNLQ